MIDYGSGFGALSQVSSSHSSAFYYLQSTNNVTGIYCFTWWNYICFYVLALCVVVVLICEMCVCRIGFGSTCEQDFGN